MYLHQFHQPIKACLYLCMCSLAYVSCIDPVIVDNNSGQIEGGSDSTPMYSDDELVALLAEHALLIRVIPVDTSNEAEVFCVGVALQPGLVITVASCFENGVRYAEVKRGASITFDNSEPRVGIVTHVYKHPGFISGIPINNGYDIAAIKITTPSNFDSAPPIASLFDGDLSTMNNLLRVGYQRGLDNVFQRRVSFGTGAQVMSEVLRFPTSPNSVEEPCLTSGGLVLSLSEDEPQVIAVSSHGNDSCTQGGSASVLGASRDFIQQAYTGMLDMSGQNHTVTGELSCAQFFLCYQVVECQSSLTIPAKMLIDELFACVNDAEMTCTDFSCYPDKCPDEYNNCVRPM